MKHTLILSMTLISGMAFSAAVFAGEGLHSFSSGDNPHANGGCASKKDKVAQFHKFNGKDWKKADAEKKLDRQDVKKTSHLKDYI